MYLEILSSIALKHKSLSSGCWILFVQVANNVLGFKRLPQIHSQRIVKTEFYLLQVSLVDSPLTGVLLIDLDQMDKIPSMLVHFSSYPYDPFPLLTPITYKSVEMVVEQPTSCGMWLHSVAEKQKRIQIIKITI